MNKFLYIFIALALVANPLLGQELNCNVIVNAERVQTTERRIFSDMEAAFSQFMNNRKWTDDTYSNEERINCNLVITVEEMPAVGNFKATVQVQSARPAYNTNYESLIFNFADRDWQFEYTESQPLEFNENTFTNNITSMLAYYAYVILGLDYDSFEELGGTAHYESARQIVNNAQQSNSPGWQQFDSSRNRYWLVENLLNAQMGPVREGLYNYHRHGLDTFIQDPDKSREVVLEVLKGVEKANSARPNSILVITFLDAKSDELVNIFSKGNMQVRREAYDILRDLDPTNIDKFKTIISN